MHKSQQNFLNLCRQINTCAANEISRLLQNIYDSAAENPSQISDEDVTALYAAAKRSGLPKETRIEIFDMAVMVGSFRPKSLNAGTDTGAMVAVPSDSPHDGDKHKAVAEEVILPTKPFKPSVPRCPLANIHYFQAEGAHYLPALVEQNIITVPALAGQIYKSQTGKKLDLQPLTFSRHYIDGIREALSGNGEYSSQLDMVEGFLKSLSLQQHQSGIEALREPNRAKKPTGASNAESTVAAAKL